MSVSALGKDNNNNNWKQKYEENGFRKQISLLCPERLSYTTQLEVKSYSNSKVLPTTDLIGTDIGNKWCSKMYYDMNSKFSRPNSAVIRGPPYAHPKDKLSQSLTTSSR